MAQRFNLTAQLQLQAPTNTQQVINQIRTQLQGVSVNVDVQANARAVTQVNQSLQNTTRQANNAARSVGVLNRNLSEAARRFGVITLATGTMLSFAQAVKRAVGEAIEFERELIKIAQTTGKTVEQLSSLTQEVTRLSTSLGVSSSSLLETARVLAQAGFSADDTRKALDILAKTTLGSSFDDITKTVEGAIAVLRQFRSEALAAGGDIKFLEQSLDAINSVSKAFAVESSDLIAVIQRVGGVFASAGGSVNELIALFTSVRATTRESAETIATGLRTIFTRIQRTETVNQLEQLGISLRDAEGRFVGAFEAVRRLSLGLSALDPRDYRFSEIVEELGGFRQIGKVIPLIQQFTIAQDALNVAQGASGSVAQDAIIAQQSLAVQAQKVREEFAALIRQLADSSTFRSIASGALQLAKALISIGEALEPVLPLLTSLLALKIGQGLAPGIGALLGFGGRRRYGGGVIRKFARGGFVPGTGNSDTVPAMLTPGEFVIRKSSAEKLGSDTLQAMNGYNRGGIAIAKSGKVNKKDIDSASNDQLEDLLNSEKINAASRLAIEDRLEQRKKSPKIARLKDDVIGGLFLQEGQGGSRGISKDLKGIQLPSSFPKIDRIEGNIYTGLLKDKASNEIRSQLEPSIINAVQTAASNTIKSFEIAPLDIDESQAAKNAVSRVDTTAIEGYIFEAFISALSGAQLSDPGATFDYVNPSASAKSRLKNIFGPDPITGRLLDAKRTLSSDSVQSGKSSIANKIVSGINNGLLQPKDFVVRNSGGSIPKFASGGDVGTDTVPALLTPGEFVINKESAQKIGYGNLRSMNRDGVSRFASGGVVGVQKFAKGGLAGAAANVPAFSRVSPDEALAERLSAALNARIAQEQKRIQQGNKNISADQALNLATLKVSNNFKGVEKDTTLLIKTVRDLEREGQKIIRSQSKYYKALDTAAQSLKPGKFIGSVAGQLKDPGVRQQAIGKIDQVAGAAQQFVFLGSAAAALASQFGGLSEVQEKAISETAGFVTGIVGIGGTIVQMFTSMLSAGTMASASNAVEAASSGVSAVADTGEAAASSAASAAVAVFTIALTAAVIVVVAVAAAFKYFAAKARAEADELEKASQEQLKSIQELNGSTNDFVKIQKQMVDKQKEAAQYDAGAIAALIGGAIGGAIGLIFGPIGMVIGAGLGAWLAGNYAVQKEAERQAEIAKKFNGELELSSKLLAETTEAQAKFKQALGDIDIEQNLAPEDRVSRRLTAQSDISGANELSVSQANRQLQRLSRERNIPISQLKEEDFSKDPELLAIFKNAKTNLSNGLEGLSIVLAESRKTLAEAAEIEITGDKSFDELIASGGLFAQAFKASQDAIRAEAEARIQALQAQRNTAKTDQEIASIDNQIKQAKERETKQLKDQEDGYRRVTEEAKKNAEALRIATAAQEAYRQSLLIVSSFNNALSAAEQGLTKLDKSLSNLDAVIFGGNFDFTKDSPAGLDNLLEVGDRNIFEKEVDQIASKIGPAGAQFAQKVKDTSRFLEKAQTELIGKKLGTEDVIDTNKILSDLGLDTKLLTPEQFSAIDKQLKEAAADGITEEEFQKIFEPLIKEGQSAADLLKRANEFSNKEIQLKQKYIETLSKQLNAELAARQSFVDTSSKAAELSAKARGEELTPAQKEAARTQRAQIGLTGLDGVAIAQAGDVAGVSAARANAQNILQGIQQQIDAGMADDRLIAQQKYYSDVVAKTTKELERLSDQTDKASDIMGQIEKERAKREAAQGVVESFVVGGEKERQGINQALAGIQSAVATGTLQNQSEEQRKATVQMLDTLKDLEIPGTGGMTGAQVKEQLIMQDAMRLGLDPEVAKAIYGKTSKEEQLIQAMDQLGGQMMAASQSNVAFEMQKTQMILNSEQQLIQALNTLAQTIMGAAPGVNPVGLSRGGNVPQYRSVGGNIFTPKGTDTVPAMLTPGEFVVNKDASKKNKELLERINSGQSPTRYYGVGGSVSRRGSQGRAKANDRSGREPIIIKSAEEQSLRGSQGRAMANDRRTKDARPSITPKPQKRGLSSLSYQQMPQRNLIGYEYTQGDGSDFMDAIYSDPSFGYNPSPANAAPITPPSYEMPIRQKGTESERRGREIRAMAYERVKQRRKEARERMAGNRQRYNQMLANNRQQYIQMMIMRMTGGDSGMMVAFNNAISSGSLRLLPQNQQMGVLRILERFKDIEIPNTGGMKGYQVAQRLMQQDSAMFGQPMGYSNGGAVSSGLDTVPAMLSPGEFVINRSSVSKYGIAFMKSLNQGKAQGFNRGGLVGSTQYRQMGGEINNTSGGGMFSIDTSRIQAVFDNAIAGFSGIFDNIVKNFSGVQNALTQLVTGMSNMTMQHTVTVEGLISVGGLNLESIKQELSTSIGQMVSQEVKRVIDENNKKFNAG